MILQFIYFGFRVVICRLLTRIYIASVVYDATVLTSCNSRSLWSTMAFPVPIILPRITTSMKMTNRTTVLSEYRKMLHLTCLHGSTFTAQLYN